LAAAAGDGDELVQDLALVVLVGSEAARTQYLEQFVLGLFAELGGHRLPPVFGNMPMRQRSAFGNRNRESMPGGRVDVVDHSAEGDGAKRLHARGAVEERLPGAERPLPAAEGERNHEPPQRGRGNLIALDAVGRLGENHAGTSLRLPRLLGEPGMEATAPRKP